MTSWCSAPLPKPPHSSGNGWTGRIRQLSVQVSFVSSHSSPTSFARCWSTGCFPVLMRSCSCSIALIPVPYRFGWMSKLIVPAYVEACASLCLRKLIRCVTLFPSTEVMRWSLASWLSKACMICCVGFAGFGSLLGSRSLGYKHVFAFTWVDARFFLSWESSKNWLTAFWALCWSHLGFYGWQS